MLVGSFGLEILLDTSTPRSERISCIQDVKDDVGGVDDLVQLIPYPLALTFVEDGLDGSSEDIIGSNWAACSVVLRHTGIAAQQLGLLQAVMVGI